MAFVLEQPYLPPGSLREFLTPPGAPAIADHEIVSLFNELGLDLEGARNGDFDTPQRWEDELSLTDGQLLAVARALLTKPEFIFLDHLDAALDGEEFSRVRQVIARREVAAIVFGNGKTSDSGYDAMLELFADGTWNWRERSVSSVEGGEVA